MKAKTEENLKKQIVHLSTLLEVSEGYPAWKEYDRQQDETIKKLVELKRPKQKQTLKKRFKLWLIKKLSD